MQTHPDEKFQFDGQIKRFFRAFKEIYHSPPEILSSAPGRINIIGEHTDYTEGYVLPAAIQLKNYFLVSKRTDRKITVWANRFKEMVTFPTRCISFSKKHNWANYVKGIIWALEKEGFAIQGVNGFICGSIPLQSGLSSSAALEVSILYGLNSLFQFHLSLESMAKIAQKAENEFVGVKCGLMDQFVSLHGQKDKALFLNCESLCFDLIPLRLQEHGIGLLVCDTKVRRELASSQYNQRRKEAFLAFRAFKEYGLKNFQGVTLAMLEQKKDGMEKALYKRARHIVTENRRVKQAVKALKSDDFETLGELLFLSHESLRDDYEVSCPELDLLVESGKEFSGCLGARMTGAGFGGSGIALVKKEKISEFKTKILKDAAERGFVNPEFYEIEIGDGARSYRLV